MNSACYLHSVYEFLHHEARITAYIVAMMLNSIILIRTIYNLHYIKIFFNFIYFLLIGSYLNKFNSNEFVTFLQLLKY